MDSVRSQSSENEEVRGQVGHRNGIRVSSISVNRLNTARRRMRRRSTVKCCDCAPPCPNRFYSSNEFLSTIPSHAVFIFLNPLMVDLLQLDYQNKKVSPFETHGPTMWTFLVATCMHCIGLAFEMKIHASAESALYRRIFSNLVLFAGALSSVALTSTFVPQPLGWLCLALSPLLLAFALLVSALRRLSEKTMEFFKCLVAQKLYLPK